MIKASSLLIGYAFGNILTAFLVAKIFHAQKPTAFGSKNPGTANVGHVLGKKAGILVFLGDLLKTVIALVIVIFLFPENTEMAILYAGLGVTLGHDFPLWNHFKGGKGVAVAGTLILFIDFKWAVISLIIALIALLIIKNLIVPPIVFMLTMDLVLFIQGRIAASFILSVLILIMLFQYRFDWQDLVAGRSKKVDLLASFKNKKG